jgi:hypothetical protein
MFLPICLISFCALYFRTVVQFVVPLKGKRQFRKRGRGRKVVMLGDWKMKGSPNKQVGRPRKRWEDVVWRDTSQILGILGWRR